MPEPTLDLADIQGNIILGYGFPFARYLFFEVSDSLAARKSLAELIPLVTRADWWEDKPNETFNIAFTHRGLSKLELPAESLDGFSIHYQQGMKARSVELNNVRQNSPEHWDALWQDCKVDVWMSVNAMSPDLRESHVQKVLAIVNKYAGLKLLETQEAGALVVDNKFTTKEHFGYTDGTGNPDIEGSGIPPRPGRGLPVEMGKWNPIKAGEFILGHLDEGGEVAEGPEPHLLSRNGSYLVYLKLHQNVNRFRTFLDEQAALYPGGKDLLKAKMVGRWDDGTPLELSPHHKDPSLAADPMRNNDFSYENDPDGVRVPLGAHIRRMNPRDTFGLGGRLALRHRIARRGLPYGQWVPYDQEANDNDERGIIFMVVNASIYRQFEFVWKQWANYGNDFGLGKDRDSIIGNHTGNGSMVIPGDPDQPKRQPPFMLKDIPQFVELRGGDYFFLPSLTALHLIAEGRVAENLSSYDQATLTKIEKVSVPEPRLEPPQATKANPVVTHESFWKWLISLPINLFHLLFDPIIAFAKNWATKHPLWVFWFLRMFKPIMIKGNTVTVSRYRDVLEVLQTDTVFHVTYAEKMGQITDGGDFFLGMQPSPEYERDVSNMRLAARPDDIPTRILPIIEKTASEIVSKSNGRLNVATTLGLFVPTQVCADYLGTLPTDPKQFAEDASIMFRFLFIPDNPPEIDEQALAAAKRTRELIDGIIHQHKSSDRREETVLARCLKMQSEGFPGLDDAKIRDNLLGLLIGMIPTTAKCCAQALDQLLDRPQQLEAAQEAARNNDDELLRKYVFEALRFNPNNPGLIRVAAQDFRLGGKRLKKGMNVIALTWSAMFDQSEVRSPSEFRIDRPASDYLHFGAGMHTCFGERISHVQIPQILKVVLRQSNLRRAEGDPGRLQMSGPFPSSLIVEFDVPQH